MANPLLDWIWPDADRRTYGRSDEWMDGRGLKTIPNNDNDNPNRRVLGTER